MQVTEIRQARAQGGNFSYAQIEKNKKKTIDLKLNA